MNLNEYELPCRTDDAKMYALATCVGADISIPFTSVTVSRIQLTFVVICVDLAICVSYFIFLNCMSRYTQLEEIEINDKKLSLTDFCVVVKNLPDVNEY